MRRLARFFAALRDALRALAPRAGCDPRVVVLTPGPLNETWLEHAFLARYLGFSLVEGGDLTVRDGGVYLKVLGGLQQVDVIVRRLDDDFADPLELRGDSSLGVPGLVHAVREGSVAVANTLGSGLVEMPALQAVLPGICRALLGEALRLPGVPAWWCGTPDGLAAVLDGLDRLVLKPAFPALAREPVFGALLSRDERETLAAEIRARPWAWVGQQELPLATAPVLRPGGLAPRRLSLRCHVAAADGGFVVMPGGLTRVAASGDTLVVSLQRGATSKDTWVCSDRPVDDFSLLAPAAEPVELTRGGRDLPSRVADELFWVGRYAERAAAMVRLLRAALVRVAERSGLRAAPELASLLRALTEVTATEPGFVGAGAEERILRPEAELLSLALDGARARGLRPTLAGLARSGRSARDRLPVDAGRLLSGLDATLTGRHPERVRRASEVLVRLDALAVQLAALDGPVLDGTTRGEGFRFLDMGRRLERALQLAALLRSVLLPAAPPHVEAPLLDALLEVVDVVMTYRRRYLARVQPHAVLDLILADGTNPRSVRFQLRALERHVRRLPRERPEVGPSEPERIAVELLTAVRLADPVALCARDAEGARPALAALLASVAAGLPRLSDVVSQRWLSHAQLPQPLREVRR